MLTSAACSDVMTNDRIAIDVALLPSEEMMDIAIEANKKVIGNMIKLNKENCLPHITLAMGCVSEGALEEIDEILKDLAGQFNEFRLKTVSGSDNELCFMIERDEGLQFFHETIMKKMTPFFTYDVKKGMVYKARGEKVNDLTLNYVRDFPLKSSLENYMPHITIGSAERGVCLSEVEFTASELALCHLGNFCTCRKILLSYILNKAD